MVGPGDDQANGRDQARGGEDSQAHDVPQAAGHLANARVVLEAIKAGHVHQQYLSSLVHILHHRGAELRGCGWSGGRIYYFSSLKQMIELFGPTLKMPGVETL